jgi:hypothetical protein
MALVGYEIEKQRIEARIREVREQLGTHGSGARAAASVANNEGGPGRKRTLSAAARKRIAAAQRKRWAEHHKKLAQAGKQ